MSLSYHEQKDRENTLKLRRLLQDLPDFSYEFFRGIEHRTSSRTKIAYAYDLKVFFQFLMNQTRLFADYQIPDFVVKDLEKITVDMIERYLEYLTYYQAGEAKTNQSIPPTPRKAVAAEASANEPIESINKSNIKPELRPIAKSNKEKGKARKLACLRSFYNYYYKKEKITYNPVVLVERPKIHDKNITRLEPNEVADLLDLIESGDKLSEKEKAFHKKTVRRDLALVTLLLGTGIRVSECVGLNLQDVDFEANGIKIVRKGGNEVIVYFGQEVEETLQAYLEQRHRIIPVSGHEQALFLSLQDKRISVRSVQNLVKKYANQLTTLKNISPHKLRSTYGTALYQETGDIYLVADVLGHKDVNTTRKHYAKIEDSRRRMAAKAVKLRDKTE